MGRSCLVVLLVLMLAANAAADVPGAWTPRSPLAVSRSTAGVAADGSRIYVVGGTTGAQLASAEVYHADSDTWAALPPLTK